MIDAKLKPETAAQITQRVHAAVRRPAALERAETNYREAARLLEEAEDELTVAIVERRKQGEGNGSAADRKVIEARTWRDKVAEAMRGPGALLSEARAEYAPVLETQLVPFRREATELLAQAHALCEQALTIELAVEGVSRKIGMIEFGTRGDPQIMAVEAILRRMLPRRGKK